MEMFVATLLEGCLSMDVGGGFETERVHRCGPKPNKDARFSRHILVIFLFRARQGVLRAAREKDKTEWKGQHICLSQDLSSDTKQKGKTTCSEDDYNTTD